MTPAARADELRRAIRRHDELYYIHNAPEIFAQQCFITMEAGEGEAFAQVAEMGLAHTVVWGSDYPHYDCTFPGALGELEETFAKLPQPDLFAEVTYTNARRFMGLEK